MAKLVRKKTWEDRKVELAYGDLTTVMTYKELYEIMVANNITYDRTLSVMFNDETWLEIDIKEVG